jgi:hypothetical protein
MTRPHSVLVLALTPGRAATAERNLCKCAIGAVAVWLLLVSAPPTARAHAERITRPTVFELFRTFSMEDGHLRRFQRPKRFAVSSPDSTVTFSRLRWRHWGSLRAVARGKARSCTADVGCTTDSTFRLVAADLTTCVRYRFYATVTGYGLGNWGTRPLELPTRPECAE